MNNELVNQIFAAAINMNLTDATGFACAFAEVGFDDGAMIRTLDGFAEALLHSRCERRSQWIRLRDSVRYAQQAENQGPIVDDKFGFQAEARERAQASFDLNRITAIGF